MVSNFSIVLFAKDEEEARKSLHAINDKDLQDPTQIMLASKFIIIGIERNQMENVFDSAVSFDRVFVFLPIDWHLITLWRSERKETLFECERELSPIEFGTVNFHGLFWKRGNIFREWNVLTNDGGWDSKAKYSRALLDRFALRHSQLCIIAPNVFIVRCLHLIWALGAVGWD